VIELVLTPDGNHESGVVCTTDVDDDWSASDGLVCRGEDAGQWVAGKGSAAADVES